MDPNQLQTQIISLLLNLDMEQQEQKGKEDLEAMKSNMQIHSLNSY